jgi:glucose/arabinose dehydrogenase
MGDNLVPDFFTRIKPGQYFGWPEFYIGNHPDPAFNKRKPAKPVTVPDVLFHAHSTPLGLIFYTGTMFPAQYRGDAFIGMRGSTNRQPRSGYMVARVEFQNGKPTPGYEEFVGGFIPDRMKGIVYGRPVGVAQLPDGSMLVADEGAGRIWRITYGK